MKIKVIIGPNPFISSLSIQVHVNFSVNVIMRLINSRETVLRTTACTFKKGENKVSLHNLHRYVAGNYSLEIKLLTGELLEIIPLEKK